MFRRRATTHRGRVLGFYTLSPASLDRCTHARAREERPSALRRADVPPRPSRLRSYGARPRSRRSAAARCRPQNSRTAGFGDVALLIGARNDRAARAGMKAAAALPMLDASSRACCRRRDQERKLAASRGRAALLLLALLGGTATTLLFSGDTRRLGRNRIERSCAHDTAPTVRRPASLAQGDLRIGTRGLWLTGSTGAISPRSACLFNAACTSYQQSGQFGARHGIILTDGRKFKSLRRHLSTLGMTPEQLRLKRNLPGVYPNGAA